MDTSVSKFLSIFLLSFLIVCSSVLGHEYVGRLVLAVLRILAFENKRVSPTLYGYGHGSDKNFVQREHKGADEQTSHSSSRKLVTTTQHDFMNTPTTFPNTPVTNPVTTPATGTGPPYTPSPAVVTVPSADPGTVMPTPITNPDNSPMPVTNPVTTPSTTIPGAQPATTYPAPTDSVPATIPAVMPPVMGNAPAVPGQSWCVARSGVPETALQAALDYACGFGGADCSSIQEGASCYNPNSLQYHASYAFNSYYQRNPVQTSCDFGGSAAITNVNPSTGSCIFTTSSSVSPTHTSPTRLQCRLQLQSLHLEQHQQGTPPAFMNTNNPAMGGGITGYGDSPPIGNMSSVSRSSSLQAPFIGCIIVVTSIIIVLDM
ncbi:Glucan endo-1,3-beta-glucosidase 1 [Sesamum angolense]|uniref:Glucan endo-1,3-beta-glucosidase 1 n=1 Tax=Sesamum angolense TaxID=2727404 RepID=A0AAE1X7T0_9LAMI|nr:Glucan endo-1,3-beta-glucosidase 1 [Sesamum angolense]